MCGINGVITREIAAEASIVSKLGLMNERIIHRGPDEDGFYVKNSEQYTLGMAMRRLSIIDLSTGKQPISSSDGKNIIVFNGEIYNYKKLREPLIEEGVLFKTTSDTEVILKLYEKYGVVAFSMLDGMFAFSIYDCELNRVFIARDFFGEKPLYYMQDQKDFVWASELKSIIKVMPIKPPISKEALNLYFRLVYIPAPHTIYDGIFKLEANNYIEYDCSNFSFEIKEIKQKVEVYAINKFSDAKKLTHDLVQQSIQDKTISDVPIGTFLSGGVDSSIVSLCVAQQNDKKIDTFSIGFEKKAFDESDKARVVAKMINSNHHEFIIGENDLIKNINEIILNFDEPFADSSALATYLISNKTKEHVKVALTGDGGDEVFGGYNKYYIGKMNSLYTKWISHKKHDFISKTVSNLLSEKEDKRGIRFKIKRLINAINYEGDFYYNIISLGFQSDELIKLIKEPFYITNVFDRYKSNVNNKSETLADFRAIDKILSLEGDMLVKVDRTSMLASLECRAPFLDKKLWSFSNSLPEDFLIKGWDKKHILKKAFEDYFPKKFLDKTKKGFGVPVGDWLRAGLKSELLEYTNMDFVLEQNLFNYKAVECLVYDHINSKVDNTSRVWAYYCFQKWYKNTYTML